MNAADVAPDADMEALFRLILGRPVGSDTYKAELAARGRRSARWFASCWLR